MVQEALHHDGALAIDASYVSITGETYTLCSYVPAQLVCSEVPGVAVVSVQHHARASTTLVLDEHEPDATGASNQAWGGAGEGF